jgi:hypothetical protein
MAVSDRELEEAASIREQEEVVSIRANRRKL